jgi:hypothetical protein
LNIGFFLPIGSLWSSFTGHCGRLQEALKSGFWAETANFWSRPQAARTVSRNLPTSSLRRLLSRLPESASKTPMASKQKWLAKKA